MREINTMSGITYNLKYLFTAETFDGQTIKQNADDKPTIADHGSAFTDLQGLSVKRFTLEGEGHTFVIDLSDGHAEIDNQVIHSPKVPPTKLELIYYRQVDQRLQMSPDGKNAKALEPIVRYFMGWQTNYRGQNYKWEMGVD